MATFSNQIDEAGYGNLASSGGGYGAGFGGGWLMFIVIAIIFWLLFRNEKHDGYGDGGNCGIRGCRPAYYDESNYEQERNLDNKLCGIDKDVHKEGDETRALIQNNYIQDLRDRLDAANDEKLALKAQIYNDGKFGAVFAELGSIKCRMPELRPVYASTVTPCCGTLPIGCGEPRRGTCGFDDI